MEQNNFNQQPWNQFTPPPKKTPQKNNRWIIWVSISLVVIGLVSWLGYKVYKAGQHFGDTIGNVAANGIGMADSLSEITKDSTYYSLYAQLGDDSLSKIYKAGLDDLKSSTDSIFAIMRSYHDGFRDTLGDASGFQMMDKRVSENYFIKTGRAKKLKNAFVVYRYKLIHDLPENEQDSSLYNFLLIDEISNAMPGFMKNLTGWENIYFNQPPMNVKLNFTNLKMQLNTFQNAILQRWKYIIESMPKS